MSAQRQGAWDGKVQAWVGEKWDEEKLPDDEENMWWYKGGDGAKR